MAESGLDSLQKTRDVIVEWKPFELRPGGKFPGTPEQESQYREMILEKHQHMWDYAREHFGLEMKEGPWGVNSRLALEGARYARAHGVEREYSHACFAAHWQETRRLDDPDTLVDLARSVGLDGDEFREQVLVGRQFRAEIAEELMQAYQMGIHGIPAFIFGGRYLISGAHPVAVLEQAVDRCVEEELVVKEQ